MRSRQAYTQLPLFPELVDDVVLRQDDEDWGAPVGGPLYEDARRLFKLVEVLGSGSCSREDIVRRMEDFYILREDDRNPNALASSQRVGKKVLRDIEFLISLSYDVHIAGRGMKAIYHLLPGTGPAIFMVDQRSLATLALLRALFVDPAKQSLQSSQDPMDISSFASNNPFAQDIVQLIVSMVSRLPQEQQRYFERMVSKPAIYFHLDLAVDYCAHRATIEKVAQAIWNNQRIHFDYYPGYRREMTHHDAVDPHRIEHREGHLYLLGYSYAQNKFFELRLDRIDPESINPLHDPINPLHRRPPITFRYWADESLTRNGVSQRWLSANIERTESYIDTRGRESQRSLIEASAYSDWRIIQQLHKYSDKVELVEPAYLRARMADEVARIYAIYHQ